MWPKNRAAFTMPELLISALLMLLLAGSTMAVYMMMSRIWSESLSITDVSRNAAIGVEKMVKGTDGNDGIREAKAISSPAAGAGAAQSISFTDTNDASRSFYLDTADGTVKSESGSVLACNVESVYFTNTGDYIQIDLTTRKDVTHREIRFCVQTKIKPRN